MTRRSTGLDYSSSPPTAHALLRTGTRAIQRPADSRDAEKRRSMALVLAGEPAHDRRTRPSTRPLRPSYLLALPSVKRAAQRRVYPVHPAQLPRSLCATITLSAPSLTRPQRSLGDRLRDGLRPAFDPGASCAPRQATPRAGRPGALPPPGPQAGLPKITGTHGLDR